MYVKNAFNVLHLFIGLVKKTHIFTYSAFTVFESKYKIIFNIKKSTPKIRSNQLSDIDIAIVTLLIFEIETNRIVYFHCISMVLKLHYSKFWVFNRLESLTFLSGRWCCIMKSSKIFSFHWYISTGRVHYFNSNSPVCIFASFVEFKEALMQSRAQYIAANTIL